MGMNKQFKITFNATVTMSDTQEEEFMGTLLEMAKDLNRPVCFDSILIAALTHGPEGALAQTIKQGMRRTIKELANADDACGLKFSPARVEVTR